MAHHSLYTYPSTNSALIKNLGLTPHTKGGCFIETLRGEQKIQDAYSDGSGPRDLYTAIYYLQTPDEKHQSSWFSTNKGVTIHTHHQGRARFTLIDPKTKQVTRKILGNNESAGESRQIMVEPGVWKMIQIPPEDLKTAKELGDKERIGCLMTLVVVPGFEYKDNTPLSQEVLVELFKGTSEGDKYVKEFESHLLED